MGLEFNSIMEAKKKITPELEIVEYNFPKENKILKSLDFANKELLIYAKSFLERDLELFYKVRKEQNQGREPFKIYSPDENGNYIEEIEPISEKMKKKYS